MKEREWTPGDTKVDEQYEYKNLGVLKNYAGSLTSNILDNMEKTRKKAGMIFSSDFDRRKTEPLIYIKFCYLALNFFHLIRVSSVNLNVANSGSWQTFFMCPNLHRATFFSKFRILTQLSLKLT